MSTIGAAARVACICSLLILANRRLVEGLALETSLPGRWILSKWLPLPTSHIINPIALTPRLLLPFFAPLRQLGESLFIPLHEVRLPRTNPHSLRPPLEVRLASEVRNPSSIWRYSGSAERSGPRGYSLTHCASSSHEIVSLRDWPYGVYPILCSHAWRWLSSLVAVRPFIGSWNNWSRDFLSASWLHVTWNWPWI